MKNENKKKEKKRTTTTTTNNNDDDTNNKDNKSRRAREEEEEEGTYRGVRRPAQQEQCRTGKVFLAKSVTALKRRELYPPNPAVIKTMSQPRYSSFFSSFASSSQVLRSLPDFCGSPFLVRFLRMRKLLIRERQRRRQQRYKDVLKILEHSSDLYQQKQ